MPMKTNEDQLRDFIEKCFASFGLDGRKKSITINNKVIWLYYSSFSGTWSYSDQEYFVKYQLDLIPLKHRFDSSRKAFKYLIKLVNKEEKC